ncbi:MULTISPECIES: PucR family transcriptional regulator [Paenibacillus]|uniref:PucR family transcriptional regulator n=1 Tax=Paenibacillus TaxID=44249 RepID=UPI0003744E3E|nr:PucR family transcriptional regulator [Paenibacillus massiliensis]
MRTTGITLQELMNISILSRAKVISGHQGLDRVVRFVDIMEVPELKGWLREGMLMLTTAYSIRHDPAILGELIYTLNEAGAAALAIKPARFLKEIPIEAVNASNECGLPILEIPPDIPYMDITQPIMELVLHRQAALLRRSEEVYRTLTTMVLENSGIQAVGDNVADLLQAPVGVIDNAGKIIVSSPQNYNWKTTEHAPLSWEINLDRRRVARLLVDKPKLDEMEEVGIEQARLVLSLELMRNKVAEDTEHRLRGNFIDELLTPPLMSRHEAEARGSKLGMNPQHLWEVAVIEGEDEPNQESLTALLELEARQRGVTPHMEFRSNRAVLFLPTPDYRPGIDDTEKPCAWAKTVDGWLQDSANRLGGFRAGIGSPVQLWNMHQSYGEARNALKVSVRLYGSRTTRFEEVEVYHLLGESIEDTGFAALFERKLGKLCQYDQEHAGDLLRTLFYYLESRGSLVDTAQRLYIHRNSVKYRLERIRDIVGFDLNQPREQFVCHLCLVYYYLRQDEQEG